MPSSLPSLPSLPSRARVKSMLALGLPIIGGMASQNVMNLVDTAMVGHLGRAALAGVGLASFLTFLSQACLAAIGSGVQAMAARRLGEGKRAEAAAPLNAALLVCVVVGVPLSAALALLAPRVFPLLVDDPAVVEHGVAYWQTRMLSVVAVGMNFSFRGYWNGVGLSRLYLRTILIMHGCGVVLNYVLIFGKLGLPALGVTGAALGSSLALWIGAATYFVLARKHAREGGFLRARPSRAGIVAVVKLSAPTAVQQTLFLAGLTTLFWIIGRVGTTELAAANVLMNVTLVAILPGLGFGLAGSSLVGQALGRGEPDDARRWGYDVAKIAALVMTVLGVPMVLFPGAVIDVFLDDAEAASVIAVAALPLALFGATAAAEGVRQVLIHALLGAGDTRRVMVASIALQWGLMLPSAYLVGPVLGHGLAAIWLCQIAHSFVGAALYLTLWRGSAWQRIEV